METLDKSKTSSSSNKITKRQLCEFILKVACNQNSDSITLKEVKKYTDSRKFKSLRDNVKNGKVSETDIWSKVEHFQSEEATRDLSEQLSNPDVSVGQQRVLSPPELVSLAINKVICFDDY